MATDYWELLCARASVSRPICIPLWSPSFFIFFFKRNGLEGSFFERERVRHYMIFINAGHVSCQNRVREKCYKNKFIVGRGLL